MWLPAFKYIKGLLAQRGQFLLPSGQPYEGSYHELYNGRTFTKDIPSVDSIEIFADDSEPHLPEPTYEQKLVSEPVYPTPEDYEKGFFLRYFVKDKRNGKIIEAKSTTYKEKTKEKFLLGVDLKWILEKPVKDIFNQGYLYKGAITRNKENTKKQDLVMKGLYDFIVEYDKFVNIESDVEGYKFEELPRVEKMRIIEKVSSIQNKPKVKPKPRFKKKKRVSPTPITPVNTNNSPSTSGGGGGGGGQLQSFDAINENLDGTSMGGNDPDNNSFNNYY